MGRCIRVELGRGLRGGMFFSVLLIGLLLSGINVMESLQRAREMSQLIRDSLAMGIRFNPGCTGFSLFISWIALHPTGAGSMLFYFLLPLLAAIPYGWSYCQDRKSGYYTQVMVRMGKRRYFAAKYLAVFVTGGLAVAIPLIADLLVCALLLPDRAVHVYDGLLPILNFALAAKLLYTNRWLYAALWCCLTFLWGGAFSCICFLPGTRFRLSTLTVLTPFAAVLGVDALIRAVCEAADWNYFSVHQLPRPGSTAFSPGWATVSVLAFLIFLTCGVCCWRVTKHELE